MRLFADLIDTVQSVERAREAHIEQALRNRADQNLFAVSNIQICRHMSPHLVFTAALGGQNAEGQQLSEFYIQCAPGVEISKAHGGEIFLDVELSFRGIGIRLVDYRAEDGLLRFQALSLPVFLRHSSVFDGLDLQPHGLERFIGGGNGVQGLGEADIGRAVVDRLFDLILTGAHTDGRFYMAGQLGHTLVDRQQRDGDQLTGLVVHVSTEGHLAKLEVLKDIQKFLIGITLCREAAEQIRSFLLFQCYPIHKPYLDSFLLSRMPAGTVGTPGLSGGMSEF